MKTSVLTLILILFTSLSFGQKVSNKNYTFLSKELKVAIIPLYNELTKFNDSISNDIFKDTLSLKFLKVKELRANLNDESIDIFQKI